MPLDPESTRTEFPSLSKEKIFFDNPGGTQVPRRVIDRMVDYLQTANANHGGAFPTSMASDEILDDAHQAMADFLNAEDAREIVFGPNMTTLTFSLSRALAREFKAGDEIIVTRLDHDANISPWLFAAEERGCKVRWLDFDVEDCTLQIERLGDLLNERTRLVAVGYASNAVGTINSVAEIVRQAHECGALCYVDAVQYAPHGPIDVKALDPDFLVVSAYKFFGPHVGALYGKLELLDRLEAYKVRPAPSEPPGKFETGTQNHEGLAGTLGAIEYLAILGEEHGKEHVTRLGSKFTGRRLQLKTAMASIQAYEASLSRELIRTLQGEPGIRIWGITDEKDISRRVPTVSFTHERHSPRHIAARLGQEGIYVWDGNYYALAVTERLGLEGHGGMVRVGAAHYNTPEEVERLGQALHRIL
ncbi:MAG TPA: cysteine desulfurase-like protein [Anaerolineales bacterium]|nr:cysteine desulfurase-like protein [Anaerolineales bacterium]